MFNKKIFALAAAAVMIAGEAYAGDAEAAAARKIGEALRNEFSPRRRRRKKGVGRMHWSKNIRHKNRGDKTRRVA